MEESNEGFNVTLTKIETRLSYMPTMNKIMQVKNARTQAILKGNMLEEKLAIQKSIKGKKRGPQRKRRWKLMRGLSYPGIEGLNCSTRNNT